jgi:deoxyribodipyrimidine photolyase
MDPRGERYFNIIKQAYLYDPRAEYIRTWCPELKVIENIDLLLNPTLLDDILFEKMDYPKRIVELLFKEYKKYDFANKISTNVVEKKNNFKKNKKNKNFFHGNIPGVNNDI